MKKYLSSKMVMFACASVVFTSCANQTQTPDSQISAAATPDNSLSGQVFKEVNAYRRNLGLAELQRHKGLDRLAQNHCEYIRKNRGKFKISGKNVSHIGFEGRALVAREQYQMLNLSENVAASKSTGKDAASSLVKLWAESKDHGFNLKGKWTHTGIGVVVDSDGTIFATELFGTMSNSQLTMRNRFTSF